MIRKTGIFILLISFLQVATSFPAELGDKFKCKSRDGKFPKPGSFCRSYYQCSNWSPKEKYCPQDQHFFPAKGYCVWPEEYPCLEKPKSKECPLPDGKFLKPGTGCRAYYDCCNGRPTEKMCSKDTLFDHSRGKCDWPEYVTCPEEPKSKECPSPNGKFLRPKSRCKIYYDCRNGVATEKRCKNDLLFDPARGKCEWPEIYTCVEDVSTTKSSSQSTSTLSISSTKKITPSTKSPKITTTDSDEDSSSTESGSSEEGTSSEENRQSSTKSEIMSTIILSTTNDENTVSTEDELTKSTTGSLSTEENSSRDVTITSAPYESSTASEISTASFTDEYVSKTTTYPELVTGETSTGVMTKTTQPEIVTEVTHSEFVTKETHPEIITLTGVIVEKTYSEIITEKTRSEATQTIKIKNDYSTTITPELTEPVTTHIFCPKPKGYFPHPYDKHKFIACIEGNPTVMNCPEDLVYDHKKRACEYNTKKRKFSEAAKYM